MVRMQHFGDASKNKPAALFTEGGGAEHGEKFILTVLAP